MPKKLKKMTELEIIENEIARHNTELAKKAENEVYKGLIIEFFAGVLNIFCHVAAFIAGAIIGIGKGK